MPILLKQSTSADILVGPLFDSTDFKTAESAVAYDAAGINVDVIKGITKADVTLANSAGNGYWRHVITGCYALTLSTTDTNTLGPLRVTFQATGVLDWWQDYLVVPAAVYDSLVAGTDTLPVDLTQVLGTAPTEGAGGRLAAGLTKLFDVASPVLTAASVNQTGDAYARLGEAGAGLTALGDTRLAYLDASVAAANNGTPPTAAAIADAVWDETATGHTDAGKAGAQVWTVLPGIATVLSGITSLAAWLRGLVRKDAMDSTAKTELNTGGGTYNETTDSTEALRDRGDSAWITATGFETTGAAATAVGTLNDLSGADAQAAAAAALAAYGVSTYAGGDTTGTTTILGRLTAQRAANLDELGAANLPADVDALNGYCDILDDATNGLAAIKAMLTTAAGDVAGLDGSTMLTAAAVKAAVEAAGSHLALIKAVTDTLSGAATAGVFSEAALANAPVSELTAEAVDVRLSSTHGSGTWGGAAGSGSRTVTVMVSDSGGDPVADAAVTLTNTAGTATICGPLTTNASGQAVFYRDDAEQGKAVVQSTALIGGGSTAYTVSGATAVAVTVTLATIPAATSPDNYVLFGYERKVEADAAFGASGVAVKVIGIDSAGQSDATANACRRIMGTSYVTDASGLWSLEVAKSLAGRRLKLRFTWTDAASVAQTEEWQAEILAASANANDQIAWADLAPTKTR